MCAKPLLTSQELLKTGYQGERHDFFPCFPLTQDLKNRNVKLVKNYKKIECVLK